MKTDMVRIISLIFIPSGMSTEPLMSMPVSIPFSGQIVDRYWRYLLFLDRVSDIDVQRRILLLPFYV